MAATRTRDDGDIWEEIHLNLQCCRPSYIITFFLELLLHFANLFEVVEISICKSYDTISSDKEGEMKCDTLHNPQCIVTFSELKSLIVQRSCGGGGVGEWSEAVEEEEENGVKPDPIKHILHLSSSC